MTLYGTVVNGEVVLDGPGKLPEGSRVAVELVVADEAIPLPDPPFEYPHPLAPYDRGKEVALLRERVAAFRAGERGLPLDEAMDRIAADLNLPPADRG